ncbi:MAG: pyridoxal-phosphate dependent enzyme [Actinomycetota bacterium]
MTGTRPVEARTAMRSRMVCSGCGTEAGPDEPYPFRCPRAGTEPDVDHVLVRVLDPSAVEFPSTASEEDSESPYARYRGLFRSSHVAERFGLGDGELLELVKLLDESVARVDGHGFRLTPFVREDDLSDRLGFSPSGGVWVKNETGNVSGSHKARHLMGLLIHLSVAQRVGLVDPADHDARPLAIASCGNAALAAAVVARAADRRLQVFVPTDADPVIVARLKELEADIVVAPREPGVPGDPTYHALKRALAGGALPFTCQGNESGLAIEGGITLGYEMASQLRAASASVDRVVVQVGGGALASAVAQGLREAHELGALDRVPALHTVQTTGASPLARAFERVAAWRGEHDASVDEAIEHARTHRREFMWPWEQEPHSVASGILDDETYDWLAVVRAMLETGGSAAVVGEATLEEANRLGFDTTGIPADHTGTSGLAGLMELRRGGEIGDDERVAVLFTGIRRA